MEEVEKDANKRFKDKQIRKEKAATFKKLGNLAFKRGEYEKALVNYDKVSIKNNYFHFYFCLYYLLFVGY